MIKRSLYMIAVLLYSAVEVDAMSLNDALQSENITMEFGDGGTIWCQYYDGKGFAPHPEYVNKDKYLYDNNTYYLSLNTLSILSNTSIGGGCSIPSLLASISGNSNISLQYSESNDKVNDEVIRSIVFAGDNSQYTGTLYLHPSINKIIFEKEESVITNISIPDAFPNNCCKCINNYQDIQRNINIYLPNNGRFGDLNVLCNSKVTINSLYYNKNNLYFLNIKHFKNNFSFADNISLIQLKYRTYSLRDITIKTTQNVIKMKDNYYKALINKIENKLNDTEKELKKYIDVQISNLKNSINNSENEKQYYNLTELITSSIKYSLDFINSKKDSEKTIDIIEDIIEDIITKLINFIKNNKTIKEIFEMISTLIQNNIINVEKTMKNEIMPKLPGIVSKVILDIIEENDRDYFLEKEQNLKGVLDQISNNASILNSVTSDHTISQISNIIKQTNVTDFVCNIIKDLINYLKYKLNVEMPDTIRNLTVDEIKQRAVTSFFGLLSMFQPNGESSAIVSNELFNKIIGSMEEGEIKEKFKYVIENNKKDIINKAFAKIGDI